MRVLATRGPVCPICGNELRNADGGQMHEVFLTRGDAQKLPEPARLQIYSPENCVILCSEDCHIEAATSAGKLLCARQILVFEGYYNTLSWLRRATLGWKGTQPDIEARYIRSVALSMSLSPLFSPDDESRADCAWQFSQMDRR